MQPDWRPISTAPRDGKPFLAFGPVRSPSDTECERFISHWHSDYGD